MLFKDCPEEYPITLYVNGRELLTIQLTEVNLEDWATGFLFAEGIIGSAQEIRQIGIDPYRGNIFTEVETTACDIDQFLKRKRIITAGCGRGVTFRSLKEVGQFKKVVSTVKIPLTYIREKMKTFAKMTPLYQKTGGMHAAAIIKPDGELIVREDIGRHNAVDKTIGAALRKGLNGSDLIMLTTGRISFEMCSKIAKFGIGVAASRTAATNLAVALAKDLSIDLIGYCRGKSAVIYTSGSHIIKESREASGTS
ncbi:formate dehydrogenase family accessory protein FdhD [Caldalkalibacillus thermarum TA2.A1]|uniref:Sulfur carrier protein FdhD n=1 Tax=Caldalkalibacillus thermarum (strain TA2.A1) TaxID=986075 RepID=F5L7M3_CALTT|nr:formate dehydrogenase accessory sulfurtransferase FdhD [Caldalkalibacillus thermarum]EGL82667.1 formate dehydrogenase family accessory protein FdhD [Caldalkalibacillus thermarum TA2.A1]QZT33385.1 formate dehydrogenase accessory sulfurtransferase FdhD [Caldalkalibacillus thermarum TA2.A1]